MLTLAYSKDYSPAGIFKRLLSNRHFQKTTLAAQWKINSGGDKVNMRRGIVHYCYAVQLREL